MNDYIASIITGVIGALTAWLVTSRKARGDIESARIAAASARAAAKAEQATALERLKSDVTEAVIKRLRDELNRVYTQKEELESKLVKVYGERDYLRVEGDRLRDERDRLRDERDAQGDRITHLEGVVSALEQKVSNISEPLEPF